MPAAEKKKKAKRRNMEGRARGCCPPFIYLWTDVETCVVAVENRETTTRHLQVRADAANTAAAQPQVLVQDAASDSVLDTTVTKDQGKVYRTDKYTIHWQAKGECGPLEVRLRVDGEITYDGRCLPDRGHITRSVAYLLEPPDYQPPGPGYVRVEGTVVDCAGETGSCVDEASRA